MHFDDLAQGVFVRKTDIVKKTSAQECVREFFFVIGRDDHDRTLFCNDGFACFIDKKLHLIEFLKKIVWKLYIGLVNFIDQ